MDAYDHLMILRLIILIYMMGFTLRHRDWLGFTIVFIYQAMVITNTMLLMPNITAFLGTPLVFLLAWYIINKNRNK